MYNAVRKNMLRSPRSTAVISPSLLVLIFGLGWSLNALLGGGRGSLAHGCHFRVGPAPLCVRGTPLLSLSFSLPVAPEPASASHVRSPLEMVVPSDRPSLWLPT